MGILSGALRGVGTYMVQEAQARREAALEQLRQDRLDQRQQIATQDSMKAAELNDERTSNNRLKELEVGHVMQMEMQNDRQSHDDATRSADQANRVEIERLQHQFRLSEQSARIMMEANNAARARGETVDWQTNEAGQRVGVVYRGGQVVEVGRTEAEYTPPGETSQGNRTSRQTRPRPAATRPSSVSARQTYTDADVQATMAANRLSRAEAIRQIEARGYTRAR